MKPVGQATLPGDQLIRRKGNILVARVSVASQSRRTPSSGIHFHVVDDETVVLPLDHPFVNEGRFASLLVRDRELADSLAEGFHELWRRAMNSLREIQVDPRGHKT